MNPQPPIIAGVFAHESEARQALNALKQAGFAHDQIGVATQGRKNVNLEGEFQKLGLARESAAYYGQQYKAGGIVVSVRPDGREQEAHNILHRYSGTDYEHQTLETQTAAGYQRSASVAPTTTDASTDEFYQPRSLKLREERLNVTKERTQTGEVDLHKEVVAEQKTVNVPVTHEEAYIERRAVTGAALDDTTPIGDEERIRVPLSEEKVNVSKQTVVTGEVSVDKRTVEETQRVAETVRREKARLERQGDAPIHGTASDRFHPNTTENEDLL
jgi:uncharacterized protein (TIGR02271 family)